MYPFVFGKEQHFPKKPHFFVKLIDIHDTFVVRFELWFREKSSTTTNERNNEKNEKLFYETSSRCRIRWFHEIFVKIISRKIATHLNVFKFTMILYLKPWLVWNMLTFFVWFHLTFIPRPPYRSTRLQKYVSMFVLKWLFAETTVYVRPWKNTFFAVYRLPFIHFRLLVFFHNWNANQSH